MENKSKMKTKVDMTKGTFYFDTAEHVQSLMA